MAEIVTFETDAAGSGPGGWSLTATGKGSPAWTVESDATAPSGSKVLRQSGTATFPLALLTGSRLRDGYIEVKFKAISGKQDRAAGIVWRARDANNYYVARANALENNVVAYKTVDGVRSSLDIVGRTGGYGVDISVPTGQWHTLRIEIADARFKVVFNGKALFEVEDATFGGAGMIGLWTKADSVTAFDGLSYGMS